MRERSWKPFSTSYLHLTRQRGCHAGDFRRAVLQIAQLLQAELADIQINIFSDVQPQIPARMMVPFEFLEHPLRFFDAHALFHREVVVEREIPIRILEGRHAPSVRMLRHWIMPAEIERAEPERMDMVLVLFEELDGL